jgi:uncharacterized membrane protein
MTKPRLLATLFALYASLAVLLLAFQMPPFMNADEGAHAMRADQILHGGLIARPDALVDGGIGAAAKRIDPINLHRDVKVTRALYAPAPWGERARLNAPNTAIYPPIFYLPAALAMGIGRQLGWTVLPTLTLARMTSGLASVAVAACAVALAGAGAVWLLALLLLPMSLAQMAAVSQDGPMLAAGALACALCIRLRDPAMAAWRRDLLLLSVCLACIGMARPPYAALAVLPLTCVRAPPWARVGAAAFALAAAALWWWIAATQVGVDVDHFHANDSGAQLLGLLKAPWRVFGIAWHTLARFGTNYETGFIGCLGWLDVNLPAAYVKSAYAMLAVAAGAAWLCGSGQRPRARLTLAASVAVCAGIFLIQYLTWTKVAADAVDGVQGRYFLLPAMVAGCLLARPGAGSRWADFLAVPVMVFPIFSIATAIHWITVRYYF